MQQPEFRLSLDIEDPVPAMVREDLAAIRYPAQRNERGTDQDGFHTSAASVVLGASESEK